MENRVKRDSIIRSYSWRQQPRSPRPRIRPKNKVQESNSSRNDSFGDVEPPNALKVHSSIIQCQIYEADLSGVRIDDCVGGGGRGGGILV